jgi:hypothetical protein
MNNNKKQGKNIKKMFFIRRLGSIFSLLLFIFLLNHFFFESQNDFIIYKSILSKIEEVSGFHINVHMIEEQMISERKRGSI